MEKTLWEVLIPTRSNKGVEFSLKHHRIWDEKAKSVSGGLTVLRTAKGEWISPQNKLFQEKMIPVRVFCTRKEIEKIAEETLVHYNQEAVIYYKISDQVYFKYKK
jgi:hypothetical protein